MTQRQPQPDLDKLLNALQLTGGERVLWTSLLSQCLSLESVQFLSECLTSNFDRRAIESMLQCLRYGQSETFSGNAFEELTLRTNDRRIVLTSIKSVLDFLATNRLRAKPSSILSYVECAQQSIELGRESGDLLDTVKDYLSTSGVNEAVSRHAND